MKAWSVNIYQTNSFPDFPFVFESIETIRARDKTTEEFFVYLGTAFATGWYEFLIMDNGRNNKNGSCEKPKGDIVDASWNPVQSIHWKPRHHKSLSLQKGIAYD